MAKPKRFKLEIELVPCSTWWSNLRKTIPKKKWDTLRKKVYAQYHNKCGICGAKRKLNCHELWSYDDKKHIQTLVNFIALCDMCHHVKHLGLASILASRGQLDYETVINHFMKVN
ncbi:MAG: HNH endonuclease, partial [Candidatus Micrarchaeota archaeon]